MASERKRFIFLAVTVLLVAVLIITAAVTLLRGPRESSVEVVSESATEFIVNDLYEGNMTIPKFNIATNRYKPDDFTERKGIVTYEGGTSLLGINVNSQKGDIDWEQVAANGVKFAMIRVGYRKNGSGKLMPDTNFEANVQGATNAGIEVGAYFYSKAVTEAEAEEEAIFVLERIRGYNITFPIAFYWEYDTNDDGSIDESSRVRNCSGEQVTDFIRTFCKKIKAAGFTPSYYCDKTMGYKKLDLADLSSYEMWYAEFRTVPSFYYDFSMWQYTKEGTVPGISKSVPISIAFKAKY